MRRASFRKTSITTISFYKLDIIPLDTRCILFPSYSGNRGLVMGWITHDKKREESPTDYILIFRWIYLTLECKGLVTYLRFLVCIGGVKNEVLVESHKRQMRMKNSETYYLLLYTSCDDKNLQQPWKKPWNTKGSRYRLQFLSLSVWTQ
jgi:hypothetical protein